MLNYDQMLTPLLKMKLDCARSIVQQFPEPLQSRMISLQDTLLRSLHEVTEEYVRSAGHPAPDSAPPANKGMNKIDIEE